jgi:hypothetical protein
MNRFCNFITWIFLFLAIYGCTPIIPETSSTPEPVLTPNGVQVTRQAVESPPVNDEATSLKTPQTTPDLVPTYQTTDLATPTATPMSPSTNSDISKILQSDLFVVNSTGILRLSLADGEREYLLRKKGDWGDWSTSFSETGQLLAYWIRTETTSELWLAHLKPWFPELMMTVDVNYDVVSLEWLANDRFLLIRLGSFEEREVGHKITIVWSSILDVTAKNIVSPENWLGSCTILAFSPQTNHLATWCPGIQEGEVEYIVVEESGEVWFTEQDPDEVLKEIQFDGETHWAWSQDRKYVAFTQFEEEEKLYYTPADINSPTTLADNNSNLYSFLNWSPNNQFLSYFGKCPDGLFCHIILDVTRQNIVWHSQVSSLGSVGRLIWSPDNQYVAVSVLGEIVIINIESHEEVLRLQNIPVVEMVWVDD